MKRKRKKGNCPELESRMSVFLMFISCNKATEIYVENTEARVRAEACSCVVRPVETGIRNKGQITRFKGIAFSVCTWSTLCSTRVGGLFGRFIDVERHLIPHNQHNEAETNLSHMADQEYREGDIQTFSTTVAHRGTQVESELSVDPEQEVTTPSLVEGV